MAADADFTDIDDISFESVTDQDALREAAEKLVTQEQPPEIDDPEDGPVTLPGGFRRMKPGSAQFEVIRTAWVRELNGEDEERIARTRLGDDPTAFVTTVLECGVERLGDTVPTREDFALLTLGDRDFLLLEIARSTYGNELEYSNVACEHCYETFGLTLALDEDVPVKRLDKFEDTEFEVRLSKDRVATVVLPTIEVTRELAETTTPAEMNTVLIAHAVQEIRGPKATIHIAGDKDAAKKLGIKDRQALIREMSERMPGPQYNEVRFTHEPGCGKENRLSIETADLFRGL